MELINPLQWAVQRDIMDEIRFLLCMKLLLGREVSHQCRKKDLYDKGGSVTVSSWNIDKLEHVMKYMSIWEENGVGFGTVIKML